MSGRACRGVTFIELCVTIGIAGILFSMALFLAQHVNAITKIRRAQAELAYWHAAIDDWFARYGEYPNFDMSISPERSQANVIGEYRYGTAGSIFNLERVVSNACVRIDLGDGNYELVYFSQHIAGAPNTIDPWRTPYIYIAADDDPYDNISNERTTYMLLSCGPDSKSPAKDDKDETERDDVYFGQ